VVIENLQVQLRFLYSFTFRIRVSALPVSVTTYPITVGGGEQDCLLVQVLLQLNWIKFNIFNYYINWWGGGGSAKCLLLKEERQVVQVEEHLQDAC
jgi:hypothetical protein